MNPTLILMAVRAAIRLGRAGEQAFGQYARERDILLPMFKTVTFPNEEMVRGFFVINKAMLSAEARPAWESFTKKAGAPPVVGDFDILVAEYARAQAALDSKVQPLADEFAGQWMIRQWAQGEKPPGPLAKVVLTIVDVAAEAAAQDPRLFGVGGNAEVLVKALAANIAAFIPDDTDQLGPRNQLGERLAGMFLKSALGALSEHPDALIDQSHVQQLVKGTLPTLVAAFPDTLAKQVDWRNVMDSLLGPVTSAGMKIVAQDPRAFFGSRFGDDGLLGPLTGAYLLKAADLGIERTFSRAGAVEIYKATLAFAAARPELFVGKAANATDQLITAVFKDLVAVADQHSPPFDRDLLAQLGAVTLDAAARAVGARLDAGGSWENVVSRILTPVVAATSTALRTGDKGALRMLASPATLESFVRIIVTQIAGTPGMITTTDNPEVNALVGSIAAAMAADENLLLSREDWMSIVSVAAAEVAANPGRLLGVQPGTATNTLLSTLLQDLLAVANARWQQGARAGGTVLFGETLREALITAISASASQATAALLNSAKVKQLAAQLTELVATKMGIYGSKEWLCLYRVLITQVIDTGALPDPLDDRIINAALATAAGVSS
ncbi:MAG TPA: hypothetical protein VMF52_02980 [Steroidobacteraceae bacterium]|nr:hypothetical protein [Steroidobacteraceae bacterium]